jgi:hypothetical protein
LVYNRTVKKYAFVGFAGLLIAALGFDFVTASRVASAQINVGESTIDIQIAGAPFDLPPEKILTWVRTAARAVAAYYGRFPVPNLLLQIRVDDGDRVHSGVTYGAERGGRITIGVGRSISEQALNDDWMLTHEMSHLGFPNMAERHHWIEEGMATYVEPWARVAIGTLAPEKVWGDLVRDLPQGLPNTGDEGLDRTHTWGRTYWGGALFCFLADIQIRERTHNRRGFRDALRGINAAGSIGVGMAILDALRAGDNATGTTALVNLYEKMATHPYPVDLNALWEKLGIHWNGTRVTLDDHAPLALVRRGIERS